MSRKKQETREAIKSAAMRLFTEKDFDTTSIEDIAQAAGIGKATIYGYFANKQDIFLTFCDEELEKAFARYQSDEQEDKPLIDRLVTYFMTKFKFLVKNHEFGRLLMREMLFPKEQNERAFSHDDRYLEILEHIFTQAQKNGEINADQPIFLIKIHFFSLYLGLVTGWYKGYVNTLEEAERGLRQLFSQALYGVSSCAKS